MGWNNFKANVQVSFGLFFWLFNILQDRKDVHGFKLFKLFRKCWVNVLNIAKWNENQESSLFILHKQ